MIDYDRMKKLFSMLFLIVTVASLALCTVASAGANPTYRTEEECQQETGKSCHPQMCDYVPPGEILEETCGKDFKKGWVPSQTQEEWQTFQDSRYTFQFEYPAKWSIEDRPGTADFLILKNEQKNKIITISGVNLAVIGISYCGAYPQDSRCEVLKTENGNSGTIDWNVNGEANAMFNQNGAYGVIFILNKVNPGTKTTFRKILSTFKFLK